MTGAHASVCPRRMTVTDFFEWNGGGHQGKLELVDGEVRAQAPASATHGLIQANLAYLVQQHFRGAGMRCMVLTEPAVEPRLTARHNVRVSDLGVTCSPIQAGQILMPEPVLLIEVLSPGNINETWDNVRAYSTIPTVREILVVHSTRVMAELLRKGADGAWPEDPEIIEAEGTLRLASIEASWPLAEVYAGTHLARGVQ
jgi:Uma2 family endonuclease